jgi:phospholipid/cholesterol/gamma-HCH transport system ATP-binding protein
VTSIVSSHDITSCFRLAHQAILMMDGKIIARGTPDEIAGSNDTARGFIEQSGIDVARVSRVPSGRFPARSPDDEPSRRDHA